MAIANGTWYIAAIHAYLKWMPLIYLAKKLMDRIEKRAKYFGYGKAILQTRPQMEAAVSLYLKRGYVLINNYPPYDKLEGAICFSKTL